MFLISLLKCINYQRNITYFFLFLAFLFICTNVNTVETKTWILHFSWWDSGRQWEAVGGNTCVSKNSNVSSDKLTQGVPLMFSDWFVCLHLSQRQTGEQARKEVWSHAPISTSPPPNQISAEIPHC